MPNVAISPLEIDENMRVELSTLKSEIGKIGMVGVTPQDGYFRQKATVAEREAHAVLAAFLARYGFEEEVDPFGNTTLSFPPRTTDRIPLWIEGGSHFDTIPGGENSDGVDGLIAIAAGFAACVKSNNFNHPEIGMRVRIWMGEEGYDGSVYTGSRMAFGRFNRKELESSYGASGTLEERMRTLGFKPELAGDTFENGSITQADIDATLCHLEGHMEQGPILVAGNTDIGIVTSIRGPIRIRVRVSGTDGALRLGSHSGAVPLLGPDGAAWRSDANRTVVHIGSRVDLLATQWAKSRDIVVTPSELNNNRALNANDSRWVSQGFSVIQEHAYIGFDIRSNDLRTRNEFLDRVMAIINDTANEMNCRAEVDIVTQSPPIPNLSSDIQNKVEACTGALNLTSKRVNCGAGHDCTVVAQAKKTDGSNIPTGLILIKGPVSHRKEGGTKFTDVVKLANVFATFARTFTKAGSFA